MSLHTVYISDSLMVVMEFALNGNLKGYLIDQRTNVHGPHSLTSKNLIKFAMEIACGMDHVTKLNVITFLIKCRYICFCPLHI